MGVLEVFRGKVDRLFIHQLASSANPSRTRHLPERFLVEEPPPTLVMKLVTPDDEHQRVVEAP